MANRAEEFRLDLTLYFGESLFKDHLLSNIEHVLRSEAEQWASNLCIWRHKRSRIENFAEDVQRAALHRGPLFDLWSNNTAPAHTHDALEASSCAVHTTH